MRVINFRVEDDLDDRLDTLARETNRTKSFYIREAIHEHLEDIEDIYLAEKRLEDVRAGRAKTIPLEEVMRRHDLEN
jgi:RHH-type rel operon transcriptional repressor/antitoxin RelB